MGFHLLGDDTSNVKLSLRPEMADRLADNFQVFGLTL